MVSIAKDERPDLVCISGDIFHQEQVGPERYSDEMLAAVDIIEGLSECSKFVVVMRGTPNHDGKNQFRVLTKMLEKNKKVAVITTPQVISTSIADIACIPGFDKQEFRARFPGLSSEEENTTWTRYISDMVMGLRAQCSPEREKPSILMAHYTVPGCNMESGQTSFFSNFEPVIPREALQTADYSATLLGHIHRPQRLTRDSVRYAGSPLKYSFSEAEYDKSVVLVTLNGMEEPSVELIPLVPKRDLRRIRGPLEKLLSDEVVEASNREDYLHVTLTDSEPVADPLYRLRQVYPNIMRLSFASAMEEEEMEIAGCEEVERRTPPQLFAEFYSQMQGEQLSEEDSKLVLRLMEKIWGRQADDMMDDAEGGVEDETD